MKRLAIFVLLFAGPAWATITNPQSGSATATTATLTATAAGDMIVVCGNRASNTEPSVPSGWQTIKHATGANTQSGTCIWKISPGGETSTPAMSNAANVAWVVIRGYDMQSGGPIGCNPTQSNGSSTSLTYPTCSMTRTDGTSELITFGTATGANTTPPDSCPTGPTGGSLTLLSTTSQPTLALCGLIGATAATTINSVTIGPTTGHCGFTFEILGFPASSGITSNLVHSVALSQSGEACSSTCTLTSPTFKASLTNNLLLISAGWTYSGTAPTVSNVYCNSDTGHATWTWTDDGEPLSDVTDTSGGATLYIAGATAGCTSVSITLSQPTITLTGHYSEWYGMATSTPLDVANSTVGATAPLGTGGSLVTTSSGDLIYNTCYPLANNLGNYTSGFVAPASGVTILDADLQFSLGTAAFIQTSSGTYSPYIDFQGFAASGGTNVGCMDAAFKTSGGSGTAPSGVYVVQQIDVSGAASTTNLEYQLLKSTDSFRIVGATSQAAQWTGISDTLGMTYATKGTADYPYWGIDCAPPSAGLDYLTLTGVPAGNGNYVLEEISGLDTSSHTACWDATAGYTTATGVGSPYTSSPSITPSTSSGLVEAMIQFGTGPATAIVGPTGAIYAYPNYTGITDSSKMTLGGGYATLANTSTSAKAFSWTCASCTSWNASAVAFKAASVVAGHCSACDISFLERREQQ